MTKKRRGVLGVEAAMLLIAIVIVTAGLAYAVTNSGFSISQDAKTVTGEGLAVAGSSLKQTGKTVGLMCIPTSTECGPHTSLNTIASPFKVRGGGGSVDLSLSTSSIRLSTNTFQSDNIYRGVVNPENDFVFVADETNEHIQKFDELGNHLLTFDGGGILDNPEGIAVDYAGNIYVADKNDNQITVFDSAGNTLFSFGSDNLLLPEGVDIGPSGKIYVADTGNSVIRVYDVTGRIIIKSIGSATLDNPGDVAVDEFGNIYVADSDDNEIEVFDPDGNRLRFFSGGGSLSSPDGIAVHNSRVYVGDRLNDRVVVFDTDGNTLFTFNDGFGLDEPEGIAIDYDGNIYVADRLDFEIVVFDSSGNKIRTIGGGPGGGDSRFNEPEDVAVQTFNQSPASIVGLAAANNLVTSTLDSTYGATVTQTSAFIYWPVTNSPRNSILDQSEQAVIVIAFASNDRPSSFDKIKTELVVRNSHNLIIERHVPTVTSSITNLN